MHKIILFLFIILFAQVSYAAFPIIPPLPIQEITQDVTPAVLKIHEKRLSPNLPTPSKGGRDKNYIVAILLSIFGGFLGAHRFYLEYYWQGALQLSLTAVMVYLFFTAMAAAHFPSPDALFAFLIFLGLGIWLLVDLIRIGSESLLPKNGEYI